MKWVLITGASTGIGYALAQVFDSYGYSIVAIARQLPQLQKLQNTLTNPSHIIPIDLTQENSIPTIVQYCHDNNIHITVLINNAGFGFVGHFSHMPIETIENMIMLNCIVLSKLSHTFLAPMKLQNKGHIINIGSVAGFLPGPLTTTYAATKAYVNSFSLGLAQELKHTNIHVSCIAPGPVHSNFQTIAGAHSFSTKLPSSHDIAHYIYTKAIKRKQFLSIPGIKNRLIVNFHVLLPLKLLLTIIEKVHKNRKPIAHNK